MISRGGHIDTIRPHHACCTIGVVHPCFGPTSEFPTSHAIGTWRRRAAGATLGILIAARRGWRTPLRGVGDAQWLSQGSAEGMLDLCIAREPAPCGALISEPCAQVLVLGGG